MTQTVTGELAAVAITAAATILASGVLRGETLAVARCDYSEACNALRRGSYTTAHNRALAVLANLDPR